MLLEFCLRIGLFVLAAHSSFTQAYRHYKFWLDYIFDLTVVENEKGGE